MEASLGVSSTLAVDLIHYLHNRYSACPQRRDLIDESSTVLLRFSDLTKPSRERLCGLEEGVKEVPFKNRLLAGRKYNLMRLSTAEFENNAVRRPVGFVHGT